MPTEEELMQAWYEYADVGVIAKRFGIIQRTLYRQWRMLRYEGKLPKTLRPYLYQQHMDAIGSGNVEESVNCFNDLLLERLIAVHGQPRPDIYPGLEKKRERL